MSDIVFNLKQPAQVPIIYWRHFADLVGLRYDQVRGMLDNGHLPRVVIGRRRFVNLVLLNERLSTPVD